MSQQRPVELYHASHMASLNLIIIIIIIIIIISLNLILVSLKAA